MTTTNYPLDDGDAATIAGMRKAVAAQKGKYMGVEGRPPFRGTEAGGPAGS